jgi:D-sedoheptulose 7-phosphate isomerase
MSKKIVNGSEAEYVEEANAIVTTSLRAESIVKDYFTGVKNILQRQQIHEIAKVATLLEEARLRGKKVVVFGNGGSAATALHFASDLAKGAIRSGKPRIKVFTLTDNIALLTAWANDNMYRNSFAEQIENLIEAEDIVIAISVSGNSWNVLRATEVAKSKGAKTIGLTGSGGEKLKKLVDIAISTPSDNKERCEDMHLVIAHAIITCLRELS